MSIKRRELKRTLSDRSMGIAVCCDTCKFCKKYFIYNETYQQDMYVDLCFLDGEPKPEDDEWLLEKLQDAHSLLIFDVPEEYRKLLMLPKDEDGCYDVEDSPRFVRSIDMCNHYLPEYINRLEKNHDEDKLV